MRHQRCCWTCVTPTLERCYTISAATTRRTTWLFHSVAACQIGWLLRLRRYPFTAPAASPDTTKRWARKYRTTTGSEARIAPAMIAPHTY